MTRKAMSNFQEIAITKDFPAPTDPFIGGPCNLPADIPWPIDKDGNPCMHLLSFPLSMVVSGSNRYVAAFIPYHDRKYYKQISDDPACNYSSILLYSLPGPPRNEYTDKDVNSLPRRIILINHDVADNSQNYSSKIFNTPAWLQDEIHFEKHTCKVALYAVDLSACFTENRGMFSDGIVYIFIHDEVELKSDGANVGKVFFQL
jgi:hypothetical protein